MKRFTSSQSKEYLAGSRAQSIVDLERQRLIQEAHDSDDVRYLDHMGLVHRLIVRVFARHFAVFFKSALAAAADRQTLSASQAKTLSRSVERRLSQGGW